MAYRAPELFDVQTGTTLDEKVDVWVSATLKAMSHDLTRNSVVRMRTVRISLPPLTLRTPNDGPRWFNRHGCLERSV